MKRRGLEIDIIFIICLVLLKINWFSAYIVCKIFITWKKYCNCQNTLKSKINYHHNTHLLCMPSLCCIIFCSFYLLPQLANCSFCEMQKDFNTSKNTHRPPLSFRRSRHANFFFITVHFVTCLKSGSMNEKKKNAMTLFYW